MKPEKDLLALREEIIESGYAAIEELKKVARESIISENEEGTDKGLAADRLKNAAATKRIAIFDAFDILQRIEEEKANIESERGLSNKKEVRFAERRAKQE